MIATPIYNGQGLGNQLANYVTVRCIALDKGYEFGVMYPERFKGTFFQNIEMGKVYGGVIPVEGQPPTMLPEGIDRYYREAGNGEYDENIKNIPDRTLIHGLLQGEEYFKHRKDEIREWLAVEPIEMPDNKCAINFRGGEYKYVKEFFLPRKYWNDAIAHMKSTRPDMTFEVHTDDPETARHLFPEYPIIRDIALNWRSIRYAKYLIISNSSFAWFPAWLNQDVKKIIAPKYWGRHNLGYWSLEQNKTKGFWYMDSDGQLECL